MSLTHASHSITGTGGGSDFGRGTIKINVKRKIIISVLSGGNHVAAIHCTTPPNPHTLYEAAPQLRWDQEEGTGG